MNPSDLAYDRAGRGEPLLLLHGLGSQRQMWAPVLPRLTQQRDVVAVDLPGHGDSPALPSHITPSPAVLADAVAAILDHLGWERAHVAGNSLGGWVALELARRGRARSVAALSPAGFWDARERAYALLSLRAQRRLARALDPLLDVINATPIGITLTCWSMMAKPWRLSSEEAAGAARNFARSPGFAATFAAAQRRCFTRGHDIAVPVTIAWGEHDRLLLPRQATRAVRALPTARLVTLAGCGHLPTWDDPEQVVRVILEAGAPVAVAP